MLRLFRHAPIPKINYSSIWKQWCKIAPTHTIVFVLHILRAKNSMPSTIRKMQLNEAFDSINEEGEIRLLEIAQMLAERFPKLLELPGDGHTDKDGAAANHSWAQSMVRPALLM